jgi:hypothetical protein
VFSLLLLEERDDAAAPGEGHTFSFGSNEKMGRLVQSGLSRCDRAIDEIVQRGGRIMMNVVKKHASGTGPDSARLAASSH